MRRRAQIRDTTAPNLGRPGLTSLGPETAWRRTLSSPQEVKETASSPPAGNAPAQPPWSASRVFLPPSEQHFPRLPPSIVQGPEEKQEVKPGETESCVNLPGSHNIAGHFASWQSQVFWVTRIHLNQESPRRILSLLDFGG